MGSVSHILREINVLVKRHKNSKPILKFLWFKNLQTWFHVKSVAKQFWIPDVFAI